MSILDLYQEYPAELGFKSRFKTIRYQERFICRKCNNTEHYLRKNRWSFHYKQWKSNPSLRSRTAIQSNELSFQYWIMHFKTNTNDVFSTKGFLGELNHRCYGENWLLIHKFWLVVRLRVVGDYLINVIENHVVFFETMHKKETEVKVYNRIRGSPKDRNILEMI